MNTVARHVVPNSAGTEAPTLKAPANATDCHMHIYDPRFPEPPNKRPSPKVLVTNPEKLYGLS